LKNTVIKNTRKYTIVTQTKVGQETSYIQHLYPETYAYLKNTSQVFNQENQVFTRETAIFNNLVIGDYSLNHSRLQFQAYIKHTILLWSYHKTINL